MKVNVLNLICIKDLENRFKSPMSISCDPTSIIDLSFLWLVNTLSNVDLSDFVIEKHNHEPWHTWDSEMRAGNGSCPKTHLNWLHVAD